MGKPLGPDGASPDDDPEDAADSIENDAKADDSVSERATAGNNRDLLSFFDADPVKAEQRYREVRRRLLQLLRYRGCGDDAEILVSDVTTVVLQMIARGTEIRSIEGLFVGVMDNVVKDWNRKRRRERLIFSDQVDEPEAPLPMDWRLAECIRTCAANLNELDFEILETSGRADREALATERRLSRKTLNNRASEARRRLKHCLEQCLGDRGAQGRASK